LSPGRAVHLNAFLRQLQAQGGHALTEQAAVAIASLTFQAAELLGIPLGEAEQPQ
jgi:hypothetical protein